MARSVYNVSIKFGNFVSLHRYIQVFIENIPSETPVAAAFWFRCAASAAGCSACPAQNQRPCGSVSRPRLMRFHSVPSDRHKNSAPPSQEERQGRGRRIRIYASSSAEQISSDSSCSSQRALLLRLQVRCANWAFSIAVEPPRENGTI